MRTSTSKSTRLLTLAVLTPLLAGCVASEGARYGAHLSAVVPADDTPDHDVALAFGLDDYRAAPLAQVEND